VKLLEFHPWYEPAEGMHIQGEEKDGISCGLTVQVSENAVKVGYFNIDSRVMQG